jgi:hypothetical protein
MKLLVDNGEQAPEVWIVHVTRSLKISDRDNNRSTRCTIHSGECQRDGKESICLTPTMLSGVATCNPKDNFSRSAGRKLAFTRAISNLSQPQRKRLWEAYFKVVKV